ncbi:MULTISPECIES: hypothetical protein [unclassified Pseudomonas]|uniref:hypothetical protein n=1 Tax=unclassified Pseudomonas TaxID=196821 RepID=UPI0030DD5FFA
MREQIETDRNAYTKLKAHDVMVGGAYEQSAEFYAEIIDNCGGKCEWLEAALKKTIGDGINMAAYAALGGGGAPKPSAGVGSASGSGPKATGAAGESAGAMRRLDYEAAPYHGKVDNAVKSRAPVNGQEALDFSIQVKPTSPRRVGIDYDSKDFVVFDKTLDTTYHGHVRSWSDLHPDMQKALQQAGMADRKGNILTGGKR